MAQNLDPSSHGRGVLQFKTGLTSLIKQKLANKDGASIDCQNDIELLWNFYLEYKSHCQVHDMQREQETMRESGSFTTEMGARAMERTRIYATVRALLDVLKILVGQAPTDRLARQILEEGSSDTSSTGWPQIGLFALGKGSSRSLGTVITKLPEDLIIEILSRLPPKSLCHCKCVSAHWYYLISHPDLRKKLPQTLAGFFFDSLEIGRSPKVTRHFQNVDGGQPLIDPSFSFLPPDFDSVRLVGGCDGLLLCSSESPFRLFVCNPATESWVMVPDPGCVGETDTLALAFDRDISPIFHVFQFATGEEIGVILGIKIYSSETGEWSYRESGWNYSGLNC